MGLLILMIYLIKSETTRYLKIIQNNQINQVKLAHHRTEFRSCFYINREIMFYINTEIQIHYIQLYKPDFSNPVATLDRILAEMFKSGKNIASKKSNIQKIVT